MIELNEIIHRMKSSSFWSHFDRLEMVKSKNLTFWPQEWRGALDETHDVDFRMPGQKLLHCRHWRRVTPANDNGKRLYSPFRLVTGRCQFAVANGDKLSEFATVCRDVTELSRNCNNCRCCYTNVNNANNWCLYFTRKYLFSLFNWTQLKHLITSDLWIWLPVFSSSASKLVLFAMSQAANRERENKPWNRDESFQYSTQIQPQPKTKFLHIYLKNRLPSYSYLNKLDS